MPKYLLERIGAVNLVNMSANKYFTDVISYFEEYLLRFTLQAMIMICLFQFSINHRTIVKAFLQSFAKGKSKFKHYLYDLGLRNVIATVIFTLGLCCSIIIPVSMPLFAVLFWLAYGIDKFNLFYVYPIEFESQLMNRKTLVVCSFIAILLFQLTMAIVTSTMVQTKTLVYMLTFVFI